MLITAKLSTANTFLQSTSGFRMDSSRGASDSFVEAQRHLREALIKANHKIVGEILEKHPELANHEYEEEDGYSGTPLLILCDRIKLQDFRYPRQRAGMYSTK